MTAALGYLDSAIAVVTADPSGFPLPSAWLNGNALTAAQFIQLCRSYQARFRAKVGRTPAERATANWTTIIADANAGITADFQITMVPPPAGGWDISWMLQHFATGSANWHQMSQFWLGMADTSGAANPAAGYDNWLSTAPASRVAFTVVTPDRRFPQGTTRAAQQANSPTPTAPLAFTATPYVRNRPSGEDQPGDPLGISQYDVYRPRAFVNASRNGPYPIMTAAEIRLYAAEGYIRTGNIPQAARLIDVSRVGNGKLPALDTTGVALPDTLTAVPGGTGCVPRVPDVAQGYKRTKCGAIWDALKWEYRMETAYAGYGMWFFAGRGWGDLPQYTALNWAVPYQEMDARRKPFYGVGGQGGRDAAGPGNYGLFAGGVYSPCGRDDSVRGARRCCPRWSAGATRTHPSPHSSRYPRPRSPSSSPTWVAWGPVPAWGPGSPGWKGRSLGRPTASIRCGSPASPTFGVGRAVGAASRCRCDGPGSATPTSGVSRSHEPTCWWGRSRRASRRSS